MGVGLIPIYSAISGLRSGELVWLLPEYTSQEMNLYALYPSRQYLDAKIRTWVEFLRDELPATLAADQEELRQFARSLKPHFAWRLTIGRAPGRWRCVAAVT